MDRLAKPQWNQKHDTFKELGKHYCQTIELYIQENYSKKDGKNTF